MPSRDAKVYLADILEFCDKLLTYTAHTTFDQFCTQNLEHDGVIHNLVLIGEAAAKLPDAVKASITDIDWRKIIALRNLLIHEYFGVDDKIVWDVLTTHMPHLRTAVHKHLG